MKRLAARAGKRAAKYAAKKALKIGLKRAGLTAWWAWPALVVARKVGLKRWDDLFHKLHLVPGGYLVPTSWLCWARQIQDADHQGAFNEQR